MADEIENAGNAQPSGNASQAGATKQASPKKATASRSKSPKSQPSAKAKASKPKTSAKSIPKKKKATQEGVTLKTFPYFDVSSPDETVEADYVSAETEMGDAFSDAQGGSDSAMNDAFSSNEVF